MTTQRFKVWSLHAGLATIGLIAATSGRWFDSTSDQAGYAARSTPDGSSLTRHAVERSASQADPQIVAMDMASGTVADLRR